MLSNTVCSTFYIMFLCAPLQAEVFSSISDIEALMDDEVKVVDILKEIRKEAELQLEVLKRYVDELEALGINPEKTGPQQLVTNPVVLFKFVNHLVSNFGRLRTVLDTTLLNESLTKMDDLRSLQKFPTDDDLIGIAEAFFRLQQTYKILPGAIANGSIPGLPRSGKLTARECFLIGHKQAELGQKYENLLFHQSAVEWLKISKKRFFEESPEERRLVSLSEILDWLQFATYRSGGNLLKVLEITQELVNIDPEYKTGEQNLKFYQQQLLRLSPKARKMLAEEYDEPEAEYSIRDDSVGELCRGERRVARKVLRLQKCFYETHNNPYLFLQPIKIEVMHQDPDVYILHDVVTSHQIDAVKALGIKYMQRAKVISRKDEEGLVSETRVSKTAFLGADLDPVLLSITKLSGHISNLNINSSEALQINNYGIGGHYLTHYDFFRDPDHVGDHLVKPYEGDRIATLMYYMSDVEAGGATIFPRLNLTIYPEKGAAAFWFNLYRDGIGDIRTLHAGCPVLGGTKWVANKWFREFSQDRFRPCQLEKDSPQLEENSLLS